MVRPGKSGGGVENWKVGGRLGVVTDSEEEEVDMRGGTPLADTTACCSPL